MISQDSSRQTLIFLKMVRKANWRVEIGPREFYIKRGKNRRFWISVCLLLIEYVNIWTNWSVSFLHRPIGPESSFEAFPENHGLIAKLHGCTVAQLHGWPLHSCTVDHYTAPSPDHFGLPGHVSKFPVRAPKSSQKFQKVHSNWKS